MKRTDHALCASCFPVWLARRRRPPPTACSRRPKPTCSSRAPVVTPSRLRQRCLGRLLPVHRRPDRQQDRLRRRRHAEPRQLHALRLQHSWPYDYNPRSGTRRCTSWPRATASWRPAASLPTDGNRGLLREQHPCRGNLIVAIDPNIATMTSTYPDLVHDNQLNVSCPIISNASTAAAATTSPSSAGRSSPRSTSAWCRCAMRRGATCWSR
jgi:hypothetical protein